MKPSAQRIPGLLEPVEYNLIRSSRRSLSVEVTRGGTVTVRAPLRCSAQDIANFLSSHSAWIEKHLELQRQYREAHPEPDASQREELIRRARAELPGLVAKYASMMGLTPSGVSITGAQKRFGSCSPANRLCFSWRLMQYPPEAIDYVVVHELAHIVHKNHGPQFYALVASVLPDHRERRRLLRE